MKKLRVLFLCTGNSCRSQMAEGVLRRLAGDRFEVYSAGITPAARVHPRAVAVMAERGIDLGGQYPKSVEEFAGQEFDYVITTCEGAREACPFFPGGGKRLHWPLPDPAAATGTEEEVRTAFRQVADEVEARLRRELLGEVASTR